MRTLTVSTARADSACRIWIGRKVIDRLAEIIEPSRYSKLALIVDKGAAQWAARVADVLGMTEAQIRAIEGGERFKSIAGLEEMWRFFGEQNLDRKSIVLSVGGGATTDLVGFAAATYMRGIAFVHVPTTLLAQVDASVGGKSGINFNGLKNLIGSVVQPAGVAIDIETLSTLPKREYRSGFAEIVKHGLIADAAYFERVTSKECTNWVGESIADVILRSCEIKRDVVQVDETEQGLRRTLNFGHTIGHAIESHALGCGISVTHGEAVSIGMVGESYLSFRSGRISREDHESIAQGIARAGLPVALPAPFPISSLRAALGHDKKNVGGAVNWSLLDRIGQATYNVKLDERVILDGLEEIQPR